MGSSGDDSFWSRQEQIFLDKIKERTGNKLPPLPPWKKSDHKVRDWNIQTFPDQKPQRIVEGNSAWRKGATSSDNMSNALRTVTTGRNVNIGRSKGE